MLLGTLGGPFHEPESIAIGVCKRHIAKPQIVVRLLRGTQSPTHELTVPSVYLIYDEMNKTPNLAIASVFRQVELHSVPDDGHENWKIRLEFVFPFQDETQAIKVIVLATLVHRDS
jgi:hypothetical protein